MHHAYAALQGQVFHWKGCCEQFYAFELGHISYSGLNIAYHGCSGAPKGAEPEA